MCVCVVDMKHAYFSNCFIICLPSFFPITKVIIELVVKYNSCLCIIFVLVIIDKYNLIYVLVYRNILMYSNKNFMNIGSLNFTGRQSYSKLHLRTHESGTPLIE